MFFGHKGSFMLLSGNNLQYLFSPGFRGYERRKARSFKLIAVDFTGEAGHSPLVISK
jgi:hypothetical protein